MRPAQYAKAIVAIFGSAVTAALGLIPESSTLWVVLTIIAAALTSAGTYLVPNKP